MRALAVAGADLVVVPQAGAVGEWPDGLYEAEMRVAAFQNGYYVALCNRVGEEDCLTFAGESFVCGPEGGVSRAGAAAAGVDSLCRCRSRCDVALARPAALPPRSSARAVRRVGRTMRAASARRGGGAGRFEPARACSGIRCQIGIYQTLEEATAGRSDRSRLGSRRSARIDAGPARGTPAGRPVVGCLLVRPCPQGRAREPRCDRDHQRHRRLRPAGASGVVATDPAIAHRSGTREGNRLSDLSGTRF